ncbi:hypothetical protein [Jeongeupia chitinilytica]|uniref:Lipocalin-like domain-containing protein n=1 Tax=Jeongeupia chitinilytica TaxID=1041641 RepID=A0ABQ3H0T3_9NEIS|nr:hypothetical protein [Jeongeupia chitinilytica]GHD63102.1 hypothetical protein GCM10007350_19850 [Jeongeupia chitinilytica]
MSTQIDPALQGSWKLKSARYTGADGKAQTFTGIQLNAVKLVAGNHFSYITHLEDGSFAVAGAGTASSADGRYSERLSHTSNAKMLGKTYTFGYRIEGDCWLSEGDEDGTHIEEVWQRV